MKILLPLIFLFSCAKMLETPRRENYYLLVFSMDAKTSRPKVVKDCAPHSLEKGKLELKSIIADYANDGLYCTQKGTYQSYTCNNTFKTVKAVLVQGKKACKSIPGDTTIRERRML
jgi:hypothetical protein